MGGAGFRLSWKLLLLATVMDNRVLRALKSGTKSLCYDNSSLRELPAAIGRCGFLQSLSAKNNHLETLPQEIALLSELRYLNIGCNELAEFPESLLSLTGLQTLHLFNNKINSLLHNLTRCLYNLVSLNLNHNRLPSLPGDVRYLTQLQYLSLSSNLLSLLPGELCSLRHLLELHLDNNQLTSLPSQIGKLTKLRKLMLQKNELASLPSSIGKCSGLQVMDVSCNKLELFPLELSKLKLKEFYFENNPLLPHIPVPAEQECEVLPLREIVSRKIVKELRNDDDLLSVLVSYYPSVDECLREAGTCSVCGEPYVNSWLDCVQFKRPKQILPVVNRSSGGVLVPLKASLCSYRCFNSGEHEFYGIAAPIA